MSATGNDFNEPLMQSPKKRKNNRKRNKLLCASVNRPIQKVHDGILSNQFDITNYLQDQSNVEQSSKQQVSNQATHLTKAPSKPTIFLPNISASVRYGMPGRVARPVEKSTSDPLSIQQFQKPNYIISHNDKHQFFKEKIKSVNKAFKLNFSPSPMHRQTLSISPEATSRNQVIKDIFQKTKRRLNCSVQISPKRDRNSSRKYKDQSLLLTLN